MVWRSSIKPRTGYSKNIKNINLLSYFQKKIIKRMSANKSILGTKNRNQMTKERLKSDE